MFKQNATLILSSKKEHTLIHVTIWMYLKGIRLSEKSQSQKVTSCVTSFTQHAQNDKVIEIENRSVVAGVRDE